MEEKAKKQFGILMTVLFGIFYFFIFARPLPLTLDLVPVWSSDLRLPPLTASQNRKSSGTSLSFSLGTSYGYFDTALGLRFIAERGFGVSLSDEGFASYDRVPENIVWRDTSGSPRFTSKEAGYPFAAGGRRFILAPNQSTVSEIGNVGDVLWKRDFPSLITSFDASSTLCVFGTLDGQLVGIDAKGSEVFSFSPGGSRIGIIFGCAVSPTGTTLAAISGIDRQRLVVLERRNEAYRVTYHRWLDSDYRRPVAMSFTAGGDELIFESPQGLGLYDVVHRVEHILEVDRPAGLSVSLPGNSNLVVLELGSRKDLVFASKTGRRLYSFQLSADFGSLRIAGNSVFIGMGRGEAMDLVRMDFSEE